MNTPLTDWKTTVLGIITLVCGVLAYFYPAMTVENQQAIVSGSGQVFDGAIQVVSAISGLVLIFKAVWHKKG